MVKKSIFGCITAICFIGICSAMEPVSNAEFQMLKAAHDRLVRENQISIDQLNEAHTNQITTIKKSFLEVYYRLGELVYLLEDSSRSISGRPDGSLWPQNWFAEFNLSESILKGIKEDEREKFNWELYWSLPPELIDPSIIARFMSLADPVKLPEESRYTVRSPIASYRIPTPDEKNELKNNPSINLFDVPVIPSKFTREALNMPKVEPIDLANRNNEPYDILDWETNEKIGVQK